jgi:hypothetical protein
MNFKFNTGAERIAVLEDLRKPSVTFPSGWDTHRIRQKESALWSFILIALKNADVFLSHHLALAASA